MPGAAARSYLFVPANRPERFDKALAAGADAVIVDLEDAVAPQDKEPARALIVQWATAKSDPLDRVLIRINDAATPWFDGDLECIQRAGIGTVMLPKAETPAQVAKVLPALPTNGAVLPIVESARGIQNVATIA